MNIGIIQNERETEIRKKLAKKQNWKPNERIIKYHYEQLIWR